MADKLDWMNKHLVLIRHLTLTEAADQEGYKIRPDLAEYFVGVRGAEEMVFKFARLEDYKSGCELLAYIAHHRAGVWWVYRCVLSLLEELERNPAAERDIADIGAGFDVEVPDFARVEIPKEDPAQMEPLNAALAKARVDFAEARAQVDPEMLQFVEDAVEVAFQEFKRVHGIHPMDLLKKLAEKVKEDPTPIDPNSPLFVEAEKLKAQIQTVRKDTVETIKAVIPPKASEHERKVRDNALDAVYRWVAVPDAVNSQKCLDIGNECPDTPAGLLALTSFWAFGDLMPLGEQAVPAPPGLAANGLVQTLLACALHKGGTRKVKERYEEYFNIGVKVISGADNWEETLDREQPPHREPAAPGTGPVGPPHNAAGEGPDKPAGGYRRWTPPSPEPRRG